MEVDVVGHVASWHVLEGKADRVILPYPNHRTGDLPTKGHVFELDPRLDFRNSLLSREGYNVDLRLLPVHRRRKIGRVGGHLGGRSPRHGGGGPTGVEMAGATGGGDRTPSFRPSLSSKGAMPLGRSSGAWRGGQPNLLSTTTLE